MCGIGGIYQFDRALRAASGGYPVTPELLRKMSDAMVHRGPDDDGTFVSSNARCGLTFRRLAIIDLSPAGHQPMISPDGRFAIVFNGEIYNHRVIREELVAKGYRYHSQTDTETILYSFQEWGEECLKKFHGMFSIALWDNERQELFCARDRIGIKPFYYSLTPDRFIWGSEIKVILQHPSVTTKLNEQALPHYLSLMMPPAPETMFAGVQKLPAGHSLRVKPNGEVIERQWWSLLDAGEPDNSITEAEAIDDLRRLLRQSIKDRMMSDVPFGVFLSGGIDSSLNVALMSELMTRPVETFSVGFKDLEKYNELYYARSIAEKFKTNHHEILIDSHDAERMASDLAWHEDEPNGDPVCVPLYFVSKLARDSGTIVVQVGEGSDEEFAGYPWLVRDIRLYNKYWKPLMMLPGSMRKAAAALANPFLGHPLAKEYLRRFGAGEDLFWGGAMAFSEAHKQGLLKRYDPANSTNKFVEQWHKDVINRYPDADYRKRLFYIELKQRLPELLLMRVDKVSMATSIEARVPFLDHRVVEYAFRLPTSVTLGPNWEPKHILKKAAEGILPNEHIYRKKMGFAAPISEWMRKDLRPMLESHLAKSRIVGEYMDKRYIDNILAAHLSGKHNFGQLLWSLFNLTLWEERYF